MRPVDFSTYQITADSTSVDSSGVESLSLMSFWTRAASGVHSSQPQGVVGKPHVESLGSYDGVVILSGLMFFILATTIHNSYYHIVERLKDFFSGERKFAQAVTPSNIGSVRHTIVLTAILCLSLSLICVSRTKNVALVQEYGLSVTQLTVVLFVGLYGFLYLKGLAYLVINWVFFDAQRNHIFISAYFFLTSLLAFFVFPVSLLDVFGGFHSRIVTFCLLFLLILYEFFLFFKLFTNFKTKKHGYVLIFLYLCAVEIVPILLIWHFLGKNGAIF